MKKFLYYIPFVILLGFIYCENRLISGTGSGSIAGTVCTAKDSMPLEDVTVRLVGTKIETQTGSTGGFILSGLPPDNITLYYKKEHYESHVETFYLGKGQNLVIEDTIFLSRNYGVISGTILDKESETAIPYAKVEIGKAEDSIPVDTTLTDSTGVFIIF